MEQIDGDRQLTQLLISSGLALKPGMFEHMTLEVTLNKTIGRCTGSITRGRTRNTQKHISVNPSIVYENILHSASSLSTFCTVRTYQQVPLTFV